jgi:hypothetical protein
VQEQIRLEAAMDPVELLRERRAAYHSAPLLERPGVAKFRGALQFMAFARAGAAPEHLAALRVAEPDLDDATFREAAMRLKGHSYRVDTTTDEYVVSSPHTWETIDVRGRSLRATNKTASALREEVAAGFRGTDAQWRALFADIARLPADVDMEYTDADGRPRGVRIELIAALPEPRRAEYQRRFAAGEFATEPSAPSERLACEVADQLSPSFSTTGEPAKFLPGRGIRPQKTHVLASNAAKQLAACAPAGSNPTICYLALLDGCEEGSKSELRGHVTAMQAALQPLAGHYSKEEKQQIDQQARLGPEAYIEDNMPDDDSMTAREKKARKRTLLEEYYRNVVFKSKPLSEAQRRARASAVHQIATARRAEQLGARQLLRDSGHYDGARLAAAFGTFDLNNPMPTPPPPPGTPMPPPPPPPGSAAAAQAAQAAAAALIATDAGSASPAPKRPKRQHSYMDRILVSVAETARVIKPDPAA